MKEVEAFDAKAQFRRDFEELFDDSIIPVEWDEKKRSRAKELTSKTKTNTFRVANIPMICKGEECYMASTCPLLAEEVHPLGGSCPIESKIVGQLMLDLIDEMDIDPTSINEVGMVRDLVDQEIQQIRKQSLLSREDIIQENVVGISEDGEPIMKRELHLAVTWEDKIHKRKSALLKSLLQTRESRFKAGAQTIDDAVTMSKVLADYQKVNLQAELDMKKKLGYVEEQDDYIAQQIAIQKAKEEEPDIIDVD
jgi:hypothetical protein